MSDGFPNDAGARDDQPPDAAARLNQARQMAQALLANQGLRAQLPDEMIAAMQGLLSPTATQEQITRGLAAVAAIATQHRLSQPEVEELANLLVAWIKTPDWGASREYLIAHAQVLLTDDAEAVLEALAKSQQTDGARQAIAEHRGLLRDARRIGVDAAFQEALHKQPENRRVSDTDINALIDEMFLIEKQGDPERVDIFCCRILALDKEHHLLSTERRGLVLGTRANALTKMSEALSGPAVLATLNEAITCYDEAFLNFPRGVAPLEWAMTKNNKGSLLIRMAELQGDRERLSMLRAAITCFDEALLERRRDMKPLQWATTQNNKGTALYLVAELVKGDERLATLDAAIACYDAALLERLRDVAPLEWANTQNNQGNALGDKAELLVGGERLTALVAAIACYDAALLERRRDVAPLEWATTQMNKGITLHAMTNLLEQNVRLAILDAAIACIDNALLERRRDVVPMDWATTQMNKGTLLAARANLLERGKRLATFDAAIGCYNAALLEYDREVSPLGWASVQINIGRTLYEKAALLPDEERLFTLDAAITCCNAALLEYHRNEAPLSWAGASNNKGSALRDKAELLAGAERLSTLDTAIACFEAALHIYPADIQPVAYRDHACVLASVLLRRVLMPEGTGEGHDQALRRGREVLATAMTAARDLALREPMLSFRQQEWAENARVFALAATFAALDGRLAESIALVEEGRARWLAEAAGRRDADLRLLRDPADRQAYLDAVLTVQQVEAWSRQAGNPLALRERAQRADAELKEVVKRMRTRYPAFLPESDVSLKGITAGLGPREALVYLVPLKAGTLMLATTSAGEPTMRWFGKLTSDAVFALAVQPDEEGRNRRGYLPAALGWADTTKLDVALDALLPQLGNDLMQWVVTQVRALGCHRAVLVAGGFLSIMPLHAASYAPLAGEPPTAPGKRRYACDDVAFTFAPSGLTLAAARRTAERQAQRGPARRAFIAGNPQLTNEGQPWRPKTHDRAGSRGYLPYAELEAKRVAELAGERIPPFAVTCVTNDQATWWEVTQGLNNSDLAHLSLHAAFNMEDPTLSALLVAFRASLLLRDLLNPETIHLDRLRLIVLSACQSGLSDVQQNSDEAVGLFGALLAAGAPAVIGTLWSVNDLATYRLMESFARRAYRGGVAPDTALRAAARELRGIPDTYATPAETGATLREEWTVEVTNIVGDTARPQTTPMREAIAEALASQPELAGARRELTPWQLAELQQQATHLGDHLSREPEHPMYWAAFVYYGAPVSLSGLAGSPDEETTIPYRRAIGQPPLMTLATPGGSAMPNDPNAPNATPDTTASATSADTTASDERALPVADSRSSSYFPDADEVCPRCHAEGYVPIVDELGRQVRECGSCHLHYLPKAFEGGTW